MPTADSDSSAGAGVDREQRRPALFKYWKWPNQKKKKNPDNEIVVVGFLIEYGCISFPRLLQIITNK